MTNTLVSSELTKYGMRLEWRREPNWFERVVLRVKPEIRVEEYSGSSTVWHKMPEFHRCGTFKEGMLSDIEARLLHEREITKEKIYEKPH